MLTGAALAAIEARRKLARAARKLRNRERYVRRMKRIYPKWGKRKKVAA